MARWTKLCQPTVGLIINYVECFKIDLVLDNFISLFHHMHIYGVLYRNTRYLHQLFRQCKNCLTHATNILSLEYKTHRKYWTLAFEFFHACF